MAKTLLKLKLVFNCLSKESNDISRHKETLYLRTPLSRVTLDEVKATIMKDYHIPACVQNIKWAGHSLKGLKYIQENDELEVTYHSKGDCVKVQDTVSWLLDCVNSLQVHGIPTQDSYNTSNYPQLKIKQQKRHFRGLWVELFQPWNEPSKYTNKLHFLSLGGLDLLITLYTQILQNKWNDTPPTFKYTEFALLHSLWSFGETLPLQRLAINKGALDLTLQSLKRSIVGDSKTQATSDDDSTPYQIPTLADVADGAMGVLGNFCELREGQDYLVTRHDILSLLISMRTNPVFSLDVHVSVSEVLMQVSNNKNSHAFLSQPGVVHTLLEEKRNDPKFNCLSSWFNMQLLSRIILESPSMLSWLHEQPDTCSVIHTAFVHLLQDTTLNKIMEYEDEAGYFWETLIPNVTGLLTPLEHGPSLMVNLQIMAQELFASTLLLILKRREHIKILCKERLIDFVTCLPWYSREHLQPRAKALVNIVRESDIPYQPPSLLNMCKAAVAVYHCGLHDVMRLSVPELACNIL